MNIENLPPEALAEITARLKLNHSFKLWLVGNKRLCSKLLEGGGMRNLRFKSEKQTMAPPLQHFPLLANLTHFEMSFTSYRPSVSIDADFIMMLPRKLVFLSLDFDNDHFAFQAAYNQDPEHFSCLRTLILLGNGLTGKGIFEAKTTKFPPNLTKFKSFYLVDDSFQLVFPPHLNDLYLRIEGGEGFLPLPSTLERVYLRFKTLPKKCPILPFNVTSFHMTNLASGNYDNWDFGCLPGMLEHLALYRLNENQINSLPLSLQSLVGISDYVLKENEIKSLSRLVNLTSINGFLPAVLESGLSAFLPRLLSSCSSSIPICDILHLPKTLTDLRISNAEDEEKIDLVLRKTTFYSGQQNSTIGNEVGKEKSEEIEIWPFPALVSFRSDRLTTYLLERLPEGVNSITVMRKDERIALNLVRLMSSKPLKTLVAGLLESERCIGELPRTLNRLWCSLQLPHILPRRHLVMKSESSSFSLPRALSSLNLGPIRISSYLWFNGLPKTLESLRVGVQAPPKAEFEKVVWPPFLTSLELVVYVFPVQGILPLLYSIPKGIETLRIPKVGEEDSGLTNETLGDWIQHYPSLRRLLLPKSSNLTKECLPMLPKRLKLLEFIHTGYSLHWCPGYDPERI